MEDNTPPQGSQPCQHISFVDIVRGALQSLPCRDWNTVNLSIALQISPRTLQRRLYNESSTLNKILGEERLSLAKRLLAENKHTADVAKELGYSCAGSFLRAMRAGGLDVRAYRKEATQPKAGV